MEIVTIQLSQIMTKRPTTMWRKSTTVANNRTTCSIQIKNMLKI